MLQVYLQVSLTGLRCLFISGKKVYAVGDIYRVEVGMYHAVLPLSNPTIYHENKPGPFLGDEDSLFPEWAPSGENQAEIDKYLFFLKQKLTD